MTSISVFGLGYVGCVSAACLAKLGHRVIGVDVNSVKVDLIKSGRTTVVEEDIEPLVCNAVSSGQLTATTSTNDAIAESTVSLICVGTPSQANGNLDLSYVERVSAQIGRALRDKRARHIIALRSTVLPGSTASVVIPTLERESGKQSGTDFGVCMNPEFLREGTSIYDFHHPPFTVIGSDHGWAAEELAALYDGIDAPLHLTTLGVAEMLKYASNCFHGVKVTFANEIGNLCKALGTDSHEVMRLFCQDTKLNISPAYLRPGFAFGGSCLGKDLRAAVYRAKQLDVETPVLSAALESNRKQVVTAYDMVRGARKKRVGVLGLSFKAGTDDLRESPVVTLVEMLIGKGYDISIFDGYVSHAAVIGANREYIEREIPHVWSLMRGSIGDVLDSADVVVIGNGAREFRDIAPKLRDDHIVIDLVRVFGNKASDGNGYRGLCW